MDQILLTFINQTAASPQLDSIMVAVTYGALILLPGVSTTLWLKGRRRLTLTVLAALATSLATALIFQFLTLRPRPEQVRFVIAPPQFPSYPSGHAAMAFAVATALALTYRRWWAWLATFSIASLIALSRVYLGLHYPSDIFGGAVVGIGAGAACYGVLAKERPNWRWLLWPQIAIVIIVSQMIFFWWMSERLQRPHRAALRHDLALPATRILQ